MIEKELTVTNQEGFRVRPASRFAGTMSGYRSSVHICCDGIEVDAKSVMRLIAACIKCGSKIRIVCDGEDEAEALEKAVNLINSGFGEKENKM